MASLALCAIIKNEYPHYIREWMDWHLPLFDQIILFNNGEEIREGIPEGLGEDRLKIIPFPGTRKQLPAYNYCCRSRAGIFDWILFIDLDEFVQGFVPRTVAESVGKEVSSISWNWRTFGFCGLAAADTRRQHDKFLEPIPDCPGNTHLKTMVRPETVYEWILGAHLPDLFPSAGKRMHSDMIREVTAQRMPVDWRNGMIDHFYTRSYEEWHAKCLRGRADTGRKRHFLEAMRMYPGGTAGDK